MLLLANQLFDLSSLFKDTRNMNVTPAAHRYCKLDLSSNRFGFIIEKAFGKLISD